MILMKSVCLRCRSLFNFRVMIQPYSLQTETRSKQNEDIFLSFGFSKEMLDGNKVRQKILTKKPEHLKVMLQFLLDAGFNHKEIVTNAQVLYLTVWSLDHRLKCMEEGGVFQKKITLDVINRVPRIFQKTVSKLKSDGWIKKDINVTRNILSYTELPKELYPSKTDDRLTFWESHSLAMEAFLMWKLDMSLEELRTKLAIYPEMKMSSIRLVMKCYDVLRNDMEFSDKLIQTHIYLLFYYPSLFYEVLNNLPKLGNESTLETLQKNPKLLIRPMDSIFEVINVCKEFGIDFEKQTFKSEILFLSPKTVRKRLRELSKDPIFKPLFLIERFPLLILRYTEAKKRSEFLREAQKDFHSVQHLTQSHSEFEGILKNGVHSHNCNDVISCLANYFKMETKEVRKELEKNNFFLTVPLITAWRTLEFLKTQGFSDQQLKTALTILLYEKESVERELEVLESRAEVECCRDPATGQLSPQLKLQLLLYFLEKPYHFTGQGIWAHSKPSQDFFTLNERYMQHVKSKNKLSN